MSITNPTSRSRHRDRGPLVRFPFVAIVPADEPGKPSGAARVRRLLKELGRRHRVQIEWQAKRGEA